MEMGEGRMTGDCSVVSMASLSLILAVSNSGLTHFFTLYRYLPTDTYGAYLITGLFPAYFVIVFFLFFQSALLLMNLHKQQKTHV